MDLNTKQIIFILSTGRTGTMFFEDFVNQTSNHSYCVHEPKPSKRFIPLSNMAYKGAISDETFFKQYANARKRLIVNENISTYIESNNFLWSGIFSLNKFIENIKILHIIRHPQDYIQSHFNHGFWNKKKRIIRTYAPYFLADLDLTREERQDPFCILAKRWLHINKVLSTYQNSNDYVRVKFEDIFDRQNNGSSLNEVRTFLTLDRLPESSLQEWLGSSKNSSKATSPKQDYIRDICVRYLEKEMEFYDYKLK